MASLSLDGPDMKKKPLQILICGRVGVSEQVFFVRVYLHECATHLSVMIKVQINEGQMSEGQKEK